MWINLSNEELIFLQKGLDLLTEKIEEELEINKAKLWAKIQRRKEGEEMRQRAKEKLDKIFREKAKELEDENKTKNSG